MGKIGIQLIHTHAMIIRDSTWAKELENYGGKVYLIGGCVRDHILGLEPKDIDILATQMTGELLSFVLGKYGKVKLVGESFGVYKFTPTNSEIEYDIALPRIDKKVGLLHTDFVVEAGAHITLEQDLKRRDFTMNALAMDLEGNIIGLPGSKEDAENNILRLCNEDGFSDDPLRMLRCVQFAARFSSDIAVETLNSLVSHAHYIQHVSAERLLIEFDKIVQKGNIERGINLFIATGLYRCVFGDKVPINNTAINRLNISTMAELIYYFTCGVDSADYYMKNLKGNLEVAKEIKCLSKLSDINSTHGTVNRYLIVFDALQLNTDAVHTTIFDTVNSKVSEYVTAYKSSKFMPKSIKELDMTGLDLVNLGITGAAIRAMIRTVLRAVINRDIINRHDQIIDYVKERL